MFAAFFRSFAWVFLLVPLTFASAVAHAQPKLEMHRAGVNADDGSGWHAGISTKGSFSIRVPIPFNDFTTYDAGTGEVTHVIGGKSSEGIKFMAAELPITANTPADLETIPKSFGSNPANKVSDISRQSKDGAEILSFLRRKRGLKRALPVHPNERGAVHALDRISQCLSRRGGGSQG